MSGSVPEWCWDWYSSEYVAPSIDPKGPATQDGDKGKVMRVGAFLVDNVRSITVSYRGDFFGGPAYDIVIGIRLVRTVQ